MKLKTSYTFISQLNFLRFFAAVAIVIFHFGQWSAPFTSALAKPFVLISNLGVTLFFVLSGFIMVHVYSDKLGKKIDKKLVTSFYKARIARIAPIYFVSLLGVLLFNFYQKGLFREDFLSFLLQVSFLQAWVPGQALTLNFTGWSLSVEMFFYALFPFLIVYFAKKDIKKQLSITAFIWLVSTAITSYIFFVYTPTVTLASNFMKFFPLLHVNSFVIGMMAGTWYTKVNKNIKIWSGIALLLLFLNPIFIDNIYNPLQHSGLLAPLFALVIIGIAQTKDRVAKLLSIKPFVIGGDISYGIYILQFPVYLWVYEMYVYLGISTTLGEAGRFFVYLIILILASYISKYTIEKWGRAYILK